MRQDVKNNYLPIAGLNESQNAEVGRIIDEIQTKSRNDAIRGYNRAKNYLLSLYDIPDEIITRMWEKFHKPLNN